MIKHFVIFVLFLVKSNEPFRSARELTDIAPAEDAKVPMSFFPSMAECRGRGCYEIDKEKKVTDLTCTKNYKGHHRTLMPGIFTLFCQHGKSYF